MLQCVLAAIILVAVAEVFVAEVFVAEVEADGVKFELRAFSSVCLNGLKDCEQIDSKSVRWSTGLAHSPQYLAESLCKVLHVEKLDSCQHWC